MLKDSLFIGLGAFVGSFLYVLTKRKKPEEPPTLKTQETVKNVVMPVAQAVAKTVVPAQKPNFNIPSVISVSDARFIVRDINKRVFNNFFDEADILAIIYVESSFRPTATRFEAHLNDHSIGLMQILTSSAKDRGFIGSARELMKPSTNILYGMKHLKWSHDYLVRRKGKITKREWISSYNMGVGNTMKGRLSADYIGKFERARKKY